MALPPGPRSSSINQTWNWIRQPFEFLDDCMKKYGETFQITLMGFGTAVILANPEHIKEVFAGDPDLLLGGKSNEVLLPFVGEYSVLLLDGKSHDRQRKLLMPAFHGDRMHSYGKEMLKLTNATIDSWPQHAPFLLQAQMQSVTTRIILRTIFGISEGERFDWICALTKEGVDLASNPLLLFKPLQLDLGSLTPWGRFMRLSRQLDDVLRGEVERRRKDPPGAGGTDILSMLMEARDEEGQQMSFQELRDELVTMLVAGHETTSTSISWAVTYLAQRPELCQRLRDEIGTAIKDGEFLPERLAKLELLDATIRETLRIRPVAPMVGRVTAAPMQIAGYDIPQGWAVCPGIYLAHRRPSVFPDPDRFDPERFLANKPTGAEWLPFGGGTRRCIGAAFASYEMKMVLASMLWRTKFRLKPGYVPRTIRRGVTLAPSDGVPILLEERRAL